MSENALVKVEGVQLPAYAQQFVDEEKYADALGEIDPRDIRAPFIKIVQGTSPESKPGWGPTRQEKAMPLGTIFVKDMHKVIQSPADFIILKRDTVYTKWENQDRPGGKMLGFTRNREDPAIVKENGLEWTEGSNNERIPPRWDTYVNLYILLAEIPDQCVVLSFYRTGLKIVRKLTQKLGMLRRSPKIPLFTWKWKLSVALEKKGDADWFAWAIEPNGFSSEAIMQCCPALYDMADMYMKASTSAEFTRELSEVATEQLKEASAEEAQEAVQTVTAPENTATGGGISAQAEIRFEDLPKTPPKQLQNAPASQPVPETLGQAVQAAFDNAPEPTQTAPQTTPQTPNDVSKLW